MYENPVSIKICSRLTVFMGTRGCCNTLSKDVMGMCGLISDSKVWSYLFEVVLPSCATELFDRVLSSCEGFKVRRLRDRTIASRF